MQGTRPTSLRLVVVSGPLAGSSYPIGSGITSVGRHTENQLVLADSTVSRRHFQIEHRADATLLTDLGSRLGTFVNGLPVSGQSIAEGDRITVGDTVLLVAGDGPATPAVLRLSDATLLAETTIERSAEQLRRDGALDGAPASELVALLDLVTALDAAAGPPLIAAKLLARALDVVPAERGAVLLAGAGPEDLQLSVAIDREAAGRGENSSAPLSVSRTLAQRALTERAGILCRDAVQDETVAGVESVQAARIRSLLAVPILSGDLRLGVLYLDRRAGDERFSEHHLELAGAMAAIAGAALALARRFSTLEGENRRLSAALGEGRSLAGDSAVMRELFVRITRVARTDSTVLLRGESGTGKELVARAIHENSARSAAPFIAINCAAISESLLESELFGHEKGAFTGAVARKEGRFEAASGGTLLLDEVAELPTALQAKLLRVLQERCIDRVGGTRSIAIDVRVIAATHQDLEQRQKDGRFREDLYHRLNVVTLKLPPLRERREDIPALARQFISRLRARFDRPGAELAPETLARLMAYSWPGNVRELENAIERALVLGVGDVLRPEDLPESMLEGPPGVPSSTTAMPGLPNYHDGVNAAKKQLIVAALAEARGSFIGAAQKLGLHPNYLHRLVTNLGLRPALEPTE